MANPLSHPISGAFYGAYGGSQLDQPNSAILTLQELLRNAINHGLADMDQIYLNFTLDVLLSILNLITFEINDREDFSSITLESLQEMEDNIASLEASLCEGGFKCEEDEERARRTKRCCREIISAFEECRQHPQGRTNSNDVEQSWQPFYNKGLDAFVAESERNGMASLREIYCRRLVVSPSLLLPQLYEWCTRVYDGEMPVSARAADTAARAVMAIIQDVVHQLRRGVGSSEFLLQDVWQYFVLVFTNMVNPTCQSENYQCLAAIRRFRLTFLFKTASEIELITVYKTGEYLIGEQLVPNCPTSVLKQKLEGLESVAALIECSEEESCTICLRNKVTEVNFGILDKCPHLFCRNCIDDWFVENVTCPNCRTKTASWTARDDFQTFKEARRESL